MSAEEERGRELVARAIKWIKGHPDSWRELLSMCRWAQRKYGHVSRDVVYTECMRRRVDVTERPDICREHDLWSALVRLASRSTPVASTSSATRGAPSTKLTRRRRTCPRYPRRRSYEA